MGYRRLAFNDASIEYVVDGPEDAPDLLLFDLGTPCAAVPFDSLTRAAAAAGMRTAIYSRAGYGTSTRLEGRSIADEAAISAALADSLGYERFHTAGWSGGGPAALACAAAVGAGAGTCRLVDRNARALFLRERAGGLPPARLLPSPKR